MAALVWVMMGLALWHFTVFVPDRFGSSIVGRVQGNRRQYKEVTRP